MSLKKDRASNSALHEMPHLSCQAAFEATAQELELQLKTDLKNGLHPKEASARAEGLESENVSRHSLLLQTLKAVSSEPVMWLYLAVCVVAIFFDRPEIGLFSALLFILHTVVRIFWELHASRLEARMRAYDVPLTRVVRNQRIMRIRGDQLVVGDVILLRRGDVIPCDLRLITSRDLTVVEPTLDGDEKKRELLALEKDAETQPTRLPHRHSPANMVYEGATVRRGMGRAVVIAVGSDTHRGAMREPIPSPAERRLPSYFATVKKRLSLVNLVTAVAVIPVTALGILILGERCSFLDIFLAALTLSVLSLTEHTVMFFRYANACARESAADDADSDSSAEIRTPETLEKLCKMDHLILMGSSALHDGDPHPHHLYTAEKMYPLDQDGKEPAVRRFAEKLYLFSLGQEDRLKYGTYKDFPGLASASQIVTDWAETDTEALLLRLERVEPSEGGVLVKLRSKETEILYLTDDPEDVAYCHTYRKEDGIASMDDAALQTWEALLEKAYGRGYRIQCLISEQAGVRCLEGYMAMAVSGCRKTAGIISAMEDSGVRVLSFMRDVYPEDQRALTEAGLFKKHGYLDLEQGTGRLQVRRALDAGIRCFVNCRTEDVLDCIQELKESGATVGVLSVERVDLPILEAADIAFTCTPTMWKDVLKKAEPVIAGVEGVFPDGHADSACASDACRQKAQVILRRCGVHGGGVCGVRRARLAAGQLSRGFASSVRFVLLSQIARILLFFLALVTGTACVSAPLLLVSGLVADGIALYTYAKGDLPKDGALSKTMRALTDMQAPHCSLLPEMILTAASCLISALIAAVTYWITGSEHGNMSYFCALSLILTQLVIAFTGHLPRRHRRGFFMLVLLICIYAGFLSVALASGLHVLWSLVLPLAQPVAWLVGYTACRLLHRIPERL